MSPVKVDDEYQKNPELKKKDIQNLLEWTKTQPHLPIVSEIEAIHFLHSNYFDMDKAKITIENYYTYRSQYLELFTDIDTNTDKMKQAHNALTVACLPKVTSEGYRVIYTTLHDTDLAVFDFVQCLKLYLLTMETIIFRQGTCNGYILLFDMKGAAFGHMLRIRPLAVKHYLTFVQDALPIRLKFVENINMPNFIDKLLALVRPFIRNEIMCLLRFRKEIEDAYENIPRDIWPQEYNSNGKELSIEELHELWWSRVVERNKDALLEEQTKRSDESKRVSQGKGLWGLLGY